MSREADIIVEEIKHYINQIELAISKADKDLYLPYDDRYELQRRLNHLADRLDDNYKEDNDDGA